jgi:hypothetical protein
MFTSFGRHTVKIGLSNVTKYRIALHARSLGKKRDKAGLVYIQIFQHFQILPLIVDQPASQPGGRQPQKVVPARSTLRELVS